MSTGDDTVRAIVIIVGTGIVIAGLSLTYAIVFGVQSYRDQHLPIVLHAFFFGSIAYLAAFISTRLVDREQIFRYAGTNAAIQAAAVIGFYVLIARDVLPWTWLGYGLALVAAIQLGAALFITLRQRAIDRLMRHYASPGDRRAFQARFDRHSYGWIAIPLGCIIAFIWVAVRGVEPDAIAALVLGCVFGVALVFLTIFLIRGAIWLLTPFVNIEERGPDEQRIVVSLSPLEFDVTKAKPDASQETRLIDAVVVAAELRQLILYNQHQLIAVGLVAALTVFHVAGIEVLDPLVVCVAVVLATALSQAPYMIGQARAQTVVLDQFSGTERESLRKQVRDLSPLSPSSTTWLSLTGSGTLGGVASGLLQKLLGE